MLTILKYYYHYHPDVGEVGLGAFIFRLKINLSKNTITCTLLVFELFNIPFLNQSKNIEYLGT
jgi:hypothetical protein